MIFVRAPSGVSSSGFLQICLGWLNLVFRPISHTSYHVIFLPVLLGATRGQRGEARHEEVETWEGHHVDSQLPQVSVQLAREPQAGGHTRHGGAHQMVKVTVGGGGQLKGPVKVRQKA